MTNCFLVIVSMLNALLAFVMPWGFTFGVVIVAPIVILLVWKGLKSIL